MFPIAFGALMHDELVNLVEAGLTVLGALRAAAARVYGLPDRRGVIKVGMRADLVLIHRIPSEKLRMVDYTSPPHVHNVYCIAV